MNPTIWVALIGGAAGLLTAALTYAVTKRREREADWRKLKLEMYREFASALAGMTEGDATRAVKVRYSLASNALQLIASKETIEALNAFRHENSVGNPHKSQEAHDRLLSRLFWEIRRDLGDKPTPKPDAFSVKLYNSVRISANLSFSGSEGAGRYTTIDATPRPRYTCLSYLGGITKVYGTAIEISARYQVPIHRATPAMGALHSRPIRLDPFAALLRCLSSTPASTKGHRHPERRAAKSNHLCIPSDSQKSPHAKA